MKAILRSARIAPKKANLIARLVRGMGVEEANTLLEKTHKKAARMVEELVKSAMANASHNDRQDVSQLMIKQIFVTQGQSLRRGVPMARGRMRPMRKFMSHIRLELGVVTPDKPKSSKNGSNAVRSAPKMKKTTKKTDSSSSSHSS